MASLARETTSHRVQTWLGGREAGTLVISDWVITEFASALSIKVHTGELSAEERPRLAATFGRMRDESLTVLPVTRTHFLVAARFTEQFGLGLRATGALHLAIAAEHGATLCTLDRRLAEAATTPAVIVAIP